MDLLAGRKTMGEQKGDILFSGVQPTRAFLRRYTGDSPKLLASPTESQVGKTAIFQDNLSGETGFSQVRSGQGQGFVWPDQGGRLATFYSFSGHYCVIVQIGIRQIQPLSLLQQGLH